MRQFRIAYQGPMGMSWGDVSTIEQARTHARRLLGSRSNPGDAYGPVEIMELRGNRFVTVELVVRSEEKP